MSPGHAATRPAFSGDLSQRQDAVGGTQCESLVEALEECLGEFERDWRKCQDAVRALKMCAKARQGEGDVAKASE